MAQAAAKKSDMIAASGIAEKAAEDARRAEALLDAGIAECQDLNGDFDKAIMLLGLAQTTYKHVGDQWSAGVAGQWLNTARRKLARHQAQHA